MIYPICSNNHLLTVLINATTIYHGSYEVFHGFPGRYSSSLYVGIINIYNIFLTNFFLLFRYYSRISMWSQTGDNQHWTLIVITNKLNFNFNKITLHLQWWKFFQSLCFLFTFYSTLCYIPHYFLTSLPLLIHASCHAAVMLPG